MTQLNKEQFSASRGGGGVELVLAGAGTGKTKTLVEKVKNIITDYPLGADNILILTFSKKAAEEIRERIILSAGHLASEITSGTFHSFSFRFLRENCRIFLEESGYDNFPKLLDDKLKNEIITDIISNQMSDFRGIPVPVIYDFVAASSSLSTHLQTMLESAGLMEKIRETAFLYEEKKKCLGYIEFEDMIGYAIKLLKNNNGLRIDVLEKFKYILVDEYQDTSENNFELVKLLLPEKNRNLFVVGDDWQSIYGFRNARVEYIIKMKNFFPDAKIHFLKVNYRSRDEIVKLSGRFIRKNRYQTRKKLESFNGKGGAVFCHRAYSFENEISMMIKIIKKELSGINDIAVLYRNNDYGRKILSDPGIAEIRDENVKFMTMHASKGLEFDTVIIAGVSDRIIPDGATDLEEERRLLYVALSRAKEKLHVIVYADRDKNLSRFGRELGVKPGKYRFS